MDYSFFCQNEFGRCFINAVLQVGVLIGKGGDTIRYLQYNSGAKIQITRDADADPQSTTRPVELIGTLSSIKKAEKLINAVIAEVTELILFPKYNFHVLFPIFLFLFLTCYDFTWRLWC